MSALKPYKVFYVCDETPDEAEVFCCWAEDKDHAKEQLLNADNTAAIKEIKQLDCDQGGDTTNMCTECPRSKKYAFDIRWEGCYRRK